MTGKYKKLLNYTVGKKNREKVLAKKIVKIVGGLGNQMFEYAFAYMLSKSFGNNVVLDLSWFEEEEYPENITPRTFDLDVFNIEYEVATKEDIAKIVYPTHRSKIKRFLGDNLKIEKFKSDGNSYVQKIFCNFDKKLLKSPEYYYYDGYFQNEKYFLPAREELLKKFTSKTPLDEKNQSILDKIFSTNSVSIHVRRGDYVTLEFINKVHGTCSVEYYQKGIDFICKRVENPHFFLFSDDINWVIENLEIKYPFTVVDFNQDKCWLDLNLMKTCKHNIIANSSFSWWGAWLNENPGKIVITPKIWKAHQPRKNAIMPKSWVKM